MNQNLRRILFGSALITVFVIGIVIGQNKFTQPKTVIHVVALRWTSESTPEQRQKAIDGIKTMAGKVPGIKNIWLKTVKVQPLTSDKPIDDVFAIEFNDEAALKAYAT